MVSIRVFLYVVLSTALLEGSFASCEGTQSSLAEVIGLERAKVFRTPYLDPKVAGVQVFVVETESQQIGAITGNRFSSQFEDHTCLHRAFNGAVYIMEAFYDGSRGSLLNKRLLEDMDKSFLEILSFDAFVNPALYMSLCRDKEFSGDKRYAPFIDKIVYCNTDDRYAPVAGIYHKSALSPDMFKIAQERIYDSIEKNEGKAAAIEHSKAVAFCLNSDYKKLLHNFNQMRNADSYQCAFVTTKFGGLCGHGVTIVINKINSNQTQLICFDGANIGFSQDSYKRCTDCVARLINEEDLINSMIIRYEAAMKPAAHFHAQMKALGFDKHPLYVSYYVPPVSPYLMMPLKKAVLLCSKYISRIHKHVGIL